MAAPDQSTQAPLELSPQWPGSPRPALLGCSGGADSVALLHLALRDAWGPHLRVIHFDHGMRPESKSEANFVESLCAHHQLAFERIELHFKADLPHFQQRAREARLNALARLARQHHCHGVFLAHHRDDQAETILWNLLRGAGSQGLSGMEARSSFPSPFADGQTELWRPLLPISRGEIEAWLRARNHNWCEDPSNATLNYQRNRLRHRALPQLAELLGREVTEPLVRSGEILRAENEFLSELASQSYAKLVSPEGQLPCRPLLAEPLALRRRIVALWLTDHGLNKLDFEAIERILVLAAAVDKPGGSPARTELPGAIKIARQGGSLQLVSPSHESSLTNSK